MTIKTWQGRGDGIDQDCSGADEACAPDRDGDGIPDSTDNCPDTRNSNQTDSDSDGKGNICDNDQRLKYMFTPDSDALKIVDSTNYQNHGTIDSSRKPRIVNLTDWAKGYAAYFDGGTDGSSDNIYLSDNSSLDYFEGLTVSAWLKPDTVTGHHSMVSKWGKDGSGWEWDFYIQDGKLSLLLNAEDSDCGGSETFAYVESKLIPANKWTHVTATYDGSKIRFYINGTVYPASSQSNMPVAELCDTSEKVRLGVSGYYDHDYIGYVDEVKISNYAKGRKEVCEQETGYRWNIATLKCRPVDFDKDGYTVSQGDCDDSNPQKYPGKGCGGVTKESVSEVLRGEHNDSNEMLVATAEKGFWQAKEAVGEEAKRIFDAVFGVKNTWVVSTTVDSAPSVILSAPVAPATGSEGSQRAFTTLPASTVETTETAPVDHSAPVEQYAPAHSSESVGFSTTTVALYYTFGDHLGSSSVTLDASGNLVQATDYFPYGGANVDEKYGSYANLYTYTGKELDSEVDLYYYGARYYNAGFSRFTSVDPALFDLGYLQSSLSDPQRLNSYSYSKNNPVKYVDPNGGFPVLALIFKGGMNAAADWFMQTAMNYFFNPGTAGDLSASAAAVNGWQVARSGAEGLLPWKTPGGRLGRAAVTAIGDVMANYLHYGDDYSMEQAMLDFGVGFIGDLAGGGLGELISKYGSDAVAKGLAKMGFNYQSVMKFMGGGIKQISETYNGVTATRMMGGWAEGKVAVIGRGMDRVSLFSKGIGAEVWGGFDSSLSPTENLANNERWVQTLKDDGYSIYDIGLDPEYTAKGDYSKGDHYGMETNRIFGD